MIFDRITDSKCIYIYIHVLTHVPTANAYIYTCTYMQISNILPTGLPHECLANLMIYFTSYERKWGNKNSSVDNIVQFTYWKKRKKNALPYFFYYNVYNSRCSLLTKFINKILEQN